MYCLIYRKKNGQLVTKFTHNKPKQNNSYGWELVSFRYCINNQFVTERSMLLYLKKQRNIRINHLKRKKRIVNILKIFNDIFH